MKHHLVPAALLLIAHLLQPTSAPAQAITGGETHALALCSDGTARAWGTGGSGELGNGSNTDSTFPVQVSPLTGITAIVGGEFHSHALKNDSTLWSWGYNSEGQLGDGTNTDSNVPVLVSSLTGITAIASGDLHSLALKGDGTIWAWGFNDWGQLGNGNYTDSNVPAQVSSLTGIKAIEGGGASYSIALKNDGTVWSWGYNYAGQFGNGTNTPSLVPVQASIAGVTAIAAG